MSELEMVLDNILKHVPVSIYWKDRKGAFGGCTNYLLQIAGYSSQDEIIGKTDHELVWRDIADAVTVIQVAQFDKVRDSLRDIQGAVSDVSNDRNKANVAAMASVCIALGSQALPWIINLFRAYYEIEDE